MKHDGSGDSFRRRNGNLAKDRSQSLREAIPSAAAADSQVAGFVRRVIELREANRELRYSVAAIDQMYGVAADCFEFAPIGCCGVDTLGGIVDINVAGAALFGSSRPAIVGRPLESFVVPEDRDALWDHFRLCVSRRVQASTDVRVLSDDGIERWIKILSAPFACPSTGPLVLVMVFVGSSGPRPTSDEVNRRSDS
jgi:PAS domain S-box-containing protein